MKEPYREIVILPYQPKDAEGLATLFYNTVHHVNAGDYTMEQLEAWAPGRMDLEQWNRRFLQHRSLVAWLGELPVGFGDMDETGYLDRLFVHWEYQRQGIATALCDRLEGEAAQSRFTTHASITARPFFEKRGYRVVKEQLAKVRGARLKNFVMEKVLPSC